MWSLMSQCLQQSSFFECHPMLSGCLGGDENLIVPLKIFQRLKTTILLQSYVDDQE